MAFKVIPNPTFTAALTIIGQGQEQKLNLTYRHKTQTEYKKVVDDVIASENPSDFDLALAIVEKWDADIDLDRSGLELLEDHQPGAVRAIIEAYAESLRVARRKN